MSHVLPLLVILSVGLLTSCDPLFGVTRRAHVALMPEPARVAALIQATPGVDDVQYHYSEGGRPLTLTGAKPANQIHTFFYRGGSNVRGELQFVVNYKQDVEFSQTLLSIGSRPPQARIDATHPIMLKLEQELEKACLLKNLQSSVVERTFGVQVK